MPNKTSLEIMQEKADADIAAGNVPRGTSVKANGHAAPAPKEAAEVQERAYIQWANLGLARIGDGTPFPTADNAERIIQGHISYSKKLYFDTFLMRKILVLADGSQREWTDDDTLATLIWIQRTLHMPKMKLSEVRHGVNAVATINRRNSLTEWLNTLVWDGVSRLNDFMRDVFHAEDSAYSADVGRCWMVSMIARAFAPGCQVDTMVVLEGGQGTYKSSALGIIGGRYYAALPAAFGTRDFLQALDGTWLAEIPDMSGFKGRDIEHVKAIITTREDRYRRPYAHDAETYPRQCVFAATANRDDWNEDETGARRFLPIRVGGIVELELLRTNRNQLLAEALHLYRNGGKWWDISGEEAREEQAKRRPDDSWEPRVRAALEAIRIRVQPELKPYVTVAQVFDELAFKMTDQGKAEQMRIARILAGLGWIRQTYREGHRIRKRWLMPREVTTSEEMLPPGGNDLFD